MGVNKAYNRRNRLNFTQIVDNFILSRCFNLDKKITNFSLISWISFIFWRSWISVLLFRWNIVFKYFRRRDIWWTFQKLFWLTQKQIGNFAWWKVWVKWLREETYNQKVVSSNPSARYWMDFFTIICCKICTVFLKRPKINEKEAEVGQI